MTHNRAGKSAISQPVNAPERRCATWSGSRCGNCFDDRPVRAQEESAGATGGVTDAVVGIGLHHIDDGVDERPRREVLARSPGALLT